MIGGQQSVADLQDALASGTARMTQLANAYAAFAPQWVNADHVAFIDWTADWTTLQKRWDTAVQKANSAISTARLSFATPNSMIPAQAEYDGLLKALRWNAPPDGAPVSKGDWDDLNNRLTAAQGHAVVYTLPQPTATDVSQVILNATQNADVVAMVTGEQALKGPAGAGIQGIRDIGWPGSDPGPKKPTSAVKWLFIGAGAAIGGLYGMKIGGALGALAMQGTLGQTIGGLVGALFGGGAVEVVSIELASAKQHVKTAAHNAVTGAAASLLTPGGK